MLRSFVQTRKAIFVIDIQGSARDSSVAGQCTVIYFRCLEDPEAGWHRGRVVPAVLLRDLTKLNAPKK
jgi:predicted cupin superfamily sugar epimerase